MKRLSSKSITFLISAVNKTEQKVQQKGSGGSGDLGDYARQGTTQDGVSSHYRPPSPVKNEKEAGREEPQMPEDKKKNTRRRAGCCPRSDRQHERLGTCHFTPSKPVKEPLRQNASKDT